MPTISSCFRKYHKAKLHQFHLNETLYIHTYSLSSSTLITMTLLPLVHGAKMLLIGLYSFVIYMLFHWMINLIISVKIYNLTTYRIWESVTRQQQIIHVPLWPVYAQELP